jgi:Fe-S-cluster-containing hydrogenase component 2
VAIWPSMVMSMVLLMLMQVCQNDCVSASEKSQMALRSYPTKFDGASDTSFCAWYAEKKFAYFIQVCQIFFRAPCSKACASYTITFSWIASLILYIF